MKSTPAKSRRRSTVLIGVTVIQLVAVITAATAWVVSGWREAGRRENTRISFILTAESLKNYDEFHGHLPSPVKHATEGQPTEIEMPNGAGRALYSWRGEVALYRDGWFGSGGRTWDLSSAWNEPANNQIANYPWQFCYDGAIPWEAPKDYRPQTCMLAITGPGTAFGSEDEPPSALKDVPGNTILVVEVRESGIHWMQPGDFDIRTMPRTIQAHDGHGISSRYAGGFHVLFADGIVWFLSDKVPFETLEKFFTLDGARTHDRQALLGPYRLAGTWPHPAPKTRTAAALVP